ncbi:Protein NRT1/ PTR FAMILY 5.3 [Hibiscus syriacus]|uniref:Protein NRT1/ PTR FAMILY 5.3 n=1 Tax=Hibiscus syriacus TaxID=106335 RepID=A0A6A3CAP6_HIBSY|nr:Protein NRT1/ PTR FAMILY 5.3 [Hibiscus syriacus]
MGNFLSSFLLLTVSDVTRKQGHQGWILNNMNKSHLDYYYAFFAVLNCLNFIFFVVVIKFHVYKAEVSDSMRVLTELKMKRLKGMTLLTLSVSVPGLKPPPCHQANVQDCKKASTAQLAVFLGALYIIAFGAGGTRPNISTICADQFDDFHPKEKAQKLSFFNWWMFSLFYGTLFANTALIYIQDNVGWTLGYGLPTVGIIISVLIFVSGTPFYRQQKPAGSPITTMTSVTVAAARKWKVPLPSDPKELYELDSLDYARNGKFKIESTLEVAKLEFFYDQALESMKSLRASYYPTSHGIRHFLSSFLLSTVSDVTRRHGHQGRILNNLNKSRLDCYFAYFAVLCLLNFIFFAVVIKF